MVLHSTLASASLHSSSPVARLAMEPIMVSSPVRMTTPQPSPVMTRELMKARLRASVGSSSLETATAVKESSR